MATPHLLLDRYIDAESPLHAQDARVKLLLTLALVVALALLPAGAWVALFVFALIIWTAVYWARIGLLRTMRRSLIALPFALVAVTLLITRPGELLLSWSFGPWRLAITDAGVTAFLSVLIKSWLSVQAMLLLMSTTHFADLLRALRQLRLPPVLVAILGFAYRYLFIMTDEAQRMLRARECRSAALPGQPAGGSITWRAAVVGRMVGTLFIRAYERSERIYVAMLSRGFNGNLVSLDERPLSPNERGFILLGTAAAAAVVWASYLFG
jgi:cobalt/nickel transport system permease protein